MTDTTSEQTERKLLDELYAEFERRRTDPAVDPARRSDADAARARRRPARVALDDAAPAGRARRRTGAGRPWRRAPRDRARQPRPGRHAYATPTLWAAIQYLGPREEAPAHRHTPDRVPVRRRGRGRVDQRRRRPGRDAPRATCCSPRAGASTSTTTPPTSRWPGSTGSTSRSCTTLDAGFFEFGPDELSTRATPDALAQRAAVGPPRAAPGRRGRDSPASPLMAYRWEHTDAALDRPAGAGGRGASRRRSSPGTPASGSPTRPPAGTPWSPCAPRCTGCAPAPAPRPPRTVGSAVWQVFDGTGTVTVGDERFEVAHGRPVRRPVLVRR